MCRTLLHHCQQTFRLCGVGYMVAGGPWEVTKEYLIVWVMADMLTPHISNKNLLVTSAVM